MFGAKRGKARQAMHLVDEKSRMDMARSASALGRIIEAHTDHRDVICKVVVELPEWVKNQEVRQSVAELWQAQGFIASVTKEGYIIVDGVRDGQTH